MKQFIISTLVVPGLIVGLSGSHHNATVNSAAAQGLAALGTVGAPFPSETEARPQDPLGPFKIQLLGARGFYYLTTPAGFAGLEVENHYSIFTRAEDLRCAQHEWWLEE